MALSSAVMRRVRGFSYASQTTPDSRRSARHLSPVPLRLMKTPAAGHPLPKGEGFPPNDGRGLFSRDVEKREVRVALCLAQQQQRQFAGVIIAPHGGLFARNVAAGWDVVPAARAVIDGVKDQTLVARLGRKIRLSK